jgi:membrane protease subunit HflC
MNKGNFVLFVALLLLVVGAQAIVVVKDTEKAILLKLGAFERTLNPGLNFKVPLMDTAIKFEGRLRTLDTQPDRVLSSESKPLLVDSFVKYKIVDAETFYTSTNGGQDRVAEDTLQRRVRDKLRNEFGKRTLQEVVSGDRDGLMESLKNSLGEDSSELEKN